MTQPMRNETVQTETGEIYLSETTTGYSYNIPGHDIHGNVYGKKETFENIRDRLVYAFGTPEAPKFRLLRRA